MAKYLNTDLIFKNRTVAGEKLAEKLIPLKITNPVVVALPRGGVQVAKPISKKLNAKLEIMVSKKIGAPGNPELAIGAVTSYGDYVISPYSKEIFYGTPFDGEKKWDYIQKQVVYLINECKEREKNYFKGIKSEHATFNGKNIILVDDGTATGMTAQAAIKSVKKQEPLYVVLAIPVISTQAYDEIAPLVDRIITLKIPMDFIAVGLHYEDFAAVTDDAIKSMLV